MHFVISSLHLKDIIVTSLKAMEKMVSKECKTSPVVRAGWSGYSG